MTTRAVELAECPRHHRFTRWPVTWYEGKPTLYRHRPCPECGWHRFNPRGTARTANGSDLERHHGNPRCVSCDRTQGRHEQVYKGSV